ncbi:hypothetical protein GF325_09285 [Candidatus Bathyarchaeota archaeon]|nr:hypothetical protein [Candidatus Bathyarchaeota archaeon]
MNQNTRSRENLAGAEKNVFQSMLDKVTDFTLNLLGMSNENENAGGQTQVMEKVKELSAKAVKTLVDGADKLIETLKLNENEMIVKAQEQMKDYLKQMGLLEDETFMNEDYY